MGSTPDRWRGPHSSADDADHPADQPQPTPPADAAGQYPPPAAAAAPPGDLGAPGDYPAGVANADVPGVGPYGATQYGSSQLGEDSSGHSSADQPATAVPRRLRRQQAQSQPDAAQPAAAQPGSAYDAGPTVPGAGPTGAANPGVASAAATGPLADPGAAPADAAGPQADPGAALAELAALYGDAVDPASSAATFVSSDVQGCSPTHSAAAHQSESSHASEVSRRGDLAAPPGSVDGAVRRRRDLRRASAATAHNEDAGGFAAGQQGNGDPAGQPLTDGETTTPQLPDNSAPTQPAYGDLPGHPAAPAQEAGNQAYPERRGDALSPGEAPAAGGSAEPSAGHQSWQDAVRQQLPAQPQAGQSTDQAHQHGEPMRPGDSHPLPGEHTTGADDTATSAGSQRGAAAEYSLPTQPDGNEATGLDSAAAPAMSADAAAQMPTQRAAEEADQLTAAANVPQPALSTHGQSSEIAAGVASAEPVATPGDYDAHTVENISRRELREQNAQRSQESAAAHAGSVATTTSPGPVASGGRAAARRARQAQQAAGGGQPPASGGGPGPGHRGEPGNDPHGEQHDWLDHDPLADSDSTDPLTGAGRADPLSGPEHTDPLRGAGHADPLAQPDRIDPLSSTSHAGLSAGQGQADPLVGSGHADPLAGRGAPDRIDPLAAPEAASHPMTGRHRAVGIPEQGSAPRSPVDGAGLSTPDPFTSTMPQWMVDIDSEDDPATDGGIDTGRTGFDDAGQSDGPGGLGGASTDAGALDDVTTSAPGGASPRHGLDHSAGGFSAGGQSPGHDPLGACDASDPLVGPSGVAGADAVPQNVASRRKKPEVQQKADPLTTSQFWAQEADWESPSADDDEAETAGFSIAQDMERAENPPPKEGYSFDNARLTMPESPDPFGAALSERLPWETPIERPSAASRDGFSPGQGRATWGQSPAAGEGGEHTGQHGAVRGGRASWVSQPEVPAQQSAAAPRKVVRPRSGQPSAGGVAAQQGSAAGHPDTAPIAEISTSGPELGKATEVYPEAAPGDFVGLAPVEDATGETDQVVDGLAGSVVPAEQDGVVGAEIATPVAEHDPASIQHLTQELPRKSTNITTVGETADDGGESVTGRVPVRPRPHAAGQLPELAESMQDDAVESAASEGEQSASTDSAPAGSPAESDAADAAGPHGGRRRIQPAVIFSDDAAASRADADPAATGSIPMVRPRPHGVPGQAVAKSETSSLTDKLPGSDVVSRAPSGAVTPRRRRVGAQEWFSDAELAEVAEAATEAAESVIVDAASNGTNAAEPDQSTLSDVATSDDAHPDATAVEPDGDDVDNELTEQPDADVDSGDAVSDGSAGTAIALPAVQAISRRQDEPEATSASNEQSGGEPDPEGQTNAGLKGAVQKTPDEAAADPVDEIDEPWATGFGQAAGSKPKDINPVNPLSQRVADLPPAADKTALESAETAAAEAERVALEAGPSPESSVGAPESAFDDGLFDNIRPRVLPLPRPGDPNVQDTADLQPPSAVPDDSPAEDHSADSSGSSLDGAQSADSKADPSAAGRRNSGPSNTAANGDGQAGNDSSESLSSETNQSKRSATDHAENTQPTTTGEPAEAESALGGGARPVPVSPRTLSAMRSLGGDDQAEPPTRTPRHGVDDRTKARHIGMAMGRRTALTMAQLFPGARADASAMSRQDRVAHDAPADQEQAEDTAASAVADQSPAAAESAVPSSPQPSTQQDAEPGIQQGDLPSTATQSAGAAGTPQSAGAPSPGLNQPEQPAKQPDALAAGETPAESVPQKDDVPATTTPPVSVPTKPGAESTSPALDVASSQEPSSGPPIATPQATMPPIATPPRKTMPPGTSTGTAPGGDHTPESAPVSAAQQQVARSLATRLNDVIAGMDDISAFPATSETQAASAADADAPDTTGVPSTEGGIARRARIRATKAAAERIRQHQQELATQEQRIVNQRNLSQAIDRPGSTPGQSVSGEASPARPDDTAAPPSTPAPIPVPGPQAKAPARKVESEPAEPITGSRPLVHPAAEPMPATSAVRVVAEPCEPDTQAVEAQTQSAMPQGSSTNLAGRRTRQISAPEQPESDGPNPIQQAAQAADVPVPAEDAPTQAVESAGAAEPLVTPDRRIGAVAQEAAAPSSHAGPEPVDVSAQQAAASSALVDPQAADTHPVTMPTPIVGGPSAPLADRKTQPEPTGPTALAPDTTGTGAVDVPLLNPDLANMAAEADAVVEPHVVAGAAGDVAQAGAASADHGNAAGSHLADVMAAPEQDAPQQADSLQPAPNQADAEQTDAADGASDEAGRKPEKKGRGRVRGILGLGLGKKKSSEKSTGDAEQPAGKVAKKKSGKGSKTPPVGPVARREAEDQLPSELPPVVPPGRAAADAIAQDAARALEDLHQEVGPAGPDVDAQQPKSYRHAGDVPHFDQDGFGLIATGGMPTVPAAGESLTVPVTSVATPGIASQGPTALPPLGAADDNVSTPSQDAAGFVADRSVEDRVVADRTVGGPADAVADDMAAHSPPEGAVSGLAAPGVAASGAVVPGSGTGSPVAGLAQPGTAESDSADVATALVPIFNHQPVPDHSGVGEAVEALHAGLAPWAAEAMAAWTRGGNRGVVEAVSGSGKQDVGVVAVLLAAQRGMKVLVIAPTAHRAGEWSYRLRQAAFELRVAVDSGAGHVSFSQCDVAVVTPSSRFLQNPPPASAHQVLVVGDQAQLVAGRWCDSSAWRAASWRLGLVTCLEPDDVGFEQDAVPFFGPVVFRMQYPRGVSEGVVAPFSLALIAVSLGPGEQREYVAGQAAVSEAKEQLARYGISGHDDDQLLRRALVAARVPGPAQEAARQFSAGMTARRDVLAEAEAKLAALVRVRESMGSVGSCVVFGRAAKFTARAADVLVRGGVSASAVCAPGGSGPGVVSEAQAVPLADTAVVVSMSDSWRHMVQRVGQVITVKDAVGLTAQTPRRVMVLYVPGTVEDPETNVSGAGGVASLCAYATEVFRASADNLTGFSDFCAGT